MKKSSEKVGKVRITISNNLSDILTLCGFGACLKPVIIYDMIYCFIWIYVLKFILVDIVVLRIRAQYLTDIFTYD